MTQDDANEADRKVTFDYLKSAHFRIVHGDGVFGGGTPRGLSVLLGFYSERAAFPTQTVHEVSSEGVLGPEVLAERTSRKSFVRELEVAVVLDVTVARSLRKWLDEKIAELEKRIESKRAEPENAEPTT